MNQQNQWIYGGVVKFTPQLRASAAGKNFLSVVLDNGSSGMGAVMFDGLAGAFSIQIDQGNSVVLKGYINQKKDQTTGHYHNSLICTGFSLDDGKSWQTEQGLKSQQQNAVAFHQGSNQSQQQNQGYQQAQNQGQQQQIPMQQQQVRPQAQKSEQFQQPVQNEQVQHLQQCQQQFQQPQQPQNQASTQQPSPQEIAAQNTLYSSPVQDQLQGQTATQSQAVQGENLFGDDDDLIF